MSHSTDIQLCAVNSATVDIDYRAPIKFGGRVVTSARLLDVEVEVETHDGRRATGRGSMPLGKVGACTTRNIPSDSTLRVMKTLGDKLVANARKYEGQGHPLEITRELASEHDSTAESACRECGVSEPMPRL